MLRSAIRYRKESNRFAKKTGEQVPVSRLVRHFPDWSSKRSGPCTSLDDRIPWMPFEAIHQLDVSLNSQSRVFEWGMGGSTLFLLDRAGEVISIEHDREWYDGLHSRLQQNAGWTGYLETPTEFTGTRSPDPADPHQYTSSSPEFGNHCFKAYVESIDRYSDESFDVIIVDGRSRPACALHAQPKIKAGGLIVVDNAERPQYREIHTMFSDRKAWERIDCSGPSPYSSLFTGNVMWRRR